MVAGRSTTVALFAVACFVATGAIAADPAKGEAIATQVCAACHGADGNSMLPMNPILAGQVAAYTAKQLANLKSGERNNPVMTGMAATLSAEDMQNIAAYYESKPAKARAARDAALVADGEKLYRGGNAVTGVAACASCHGPNGSGIPAQYPRLAGQYQDYTIAQLKAFRSGERANDPNKMMRAIAAKLSDHDIQAIAEYIAGLR